MKEHPGQGLSLRTPFGEVRLGSRSFCGIVDDGAEGSTDGALELWWRDERGNTQRFAFADQLRDDASAVVADLARNGVAVSLISGDRPAAVAAASSRVGIANAQGGVDPAGKVARLSVLRKAGRRVLMVGDGLNDAPALAAASISMSPASAVDVTQNAADVVFQGALLAPVRETLDVARRADRLVRQNLVLAIGYNLAAVPLAVMGFVTPLVAAAAMSSSSLIVIANALRLGRLRR
jgi:Cu2+-exporting ATPase